MQMNQWLLGSAVACLASLVLMVVGVVWGVKRPEATVAPDTVTYRRRSILYLFDDVRNTWIRLIIASLALGWVALGMLWRGMY